MTAKQFYLYFNSNMVRLKDEKPESPGGQIYRFQFQYGSIKRPVQYQSPLTGFEFQFQYGSIKS